MLGVVNYKELKKGGNLSLSEFGFVTSGGRTLEGNGVTPDVPVKLTIKDIAAGRDTALERAEQYLKRVSSNKK